MNQKFSQIYSNSIKNPEEFWKKISEDIFWFKKLKVDHLDHLKFFHLSFLSDR